MAAFARELAEARGAAALAGVEILRLYTEFEAIADAPANISTEADHRAQEIILKHLSQAFPADAFCAEEATSTLGQLLRRGPRLWVIDPIDGSRGFAKKLGEFSVMIGLVEEGVVKVGVVLEPARGRLTYAMHGQGCWREDGKEVRRRCQVSAGAAWNEAILVRSRSEEQRAAPAAGQKQIFTYSAGIKLATIARGQADAYTSDYHAFHAWDLCAGQILVEEAGGRTTDARGAPIRYSEDGSAMIDGVVASNGKLHDAALGALRRPM